MKRKGKFLLILITALSMVVSLFMGLTGIAGSPEAQPKGMRLALSDDFSSATQEPKFRTDSEWLTHETVGFYRSTTSTQSIIYSLSQSEGFKGIAKAQIKINSEGGLGGHEYRVSNNVLLFNVYAGADDQSLIKLETIYSDAGNGDLLFVTKDAVKPGAKILKLEFEAIGSNNNYSLGFKNVDIYTYYNESLEVLENNLIDPEEMRLHMPLEDGNEWSYHETIGYYRSSSETQSIIYEVKDSSSAAYLGIKDFEIDVYVDSSSPTALETYGFYLGNAAKIVVYAGSSLESLAPVELSYQLKPGTSTNLIFKPTANLEADTHYIKISIEKVGANNNWCLGFHNIKFIGNYGAREIIEVTSVTVDNTENEIVAGGDALAFYGTVLPENTTYKTIIWKVYSDYALTELSQIAQFRGNLLSADHTQSLPVNVYVVGEAGGVKSAPFEVSVLPRPNPESVEISYYPATLNEGDEDLLSAVVLPSNANDKTVTFYAFNDEQCTITSDKATIAGNKITAISEGKVYVKAVSNTGSVSSEPVEIIIKKDVLLLSDKCDSLSYLYKDTNKDLLQIANNTIMRYNPNQPRGYAAGPANDIEGLTKYSPGEVIYKVNNNMLRFEVNAVIYASTQSALKDANNNPYLDHQYEVFVSSDGSAWTFVDTDYTVSEPTVGGPVTAADYAQFKIYNTVHLPAESKYLKIVLVGPVSMISDDPEVNPATNFYNSTIPVSQNPNAGYDKIYAFYNTFSPALCGVKIYAAPGTEIIDSIVAVSIPGRNMIAKKGTPYNINAYVTYSKDIETPVLLTDWSLGTVEILSGEEYLEYSNGTFTIKDNFDNQIESASFKIVLGDIESEVYSIYLSIPAQSVSLTIANATINVRNDYYPLNISILPSNTTDKTLLFGAELADGSSASQYVQFTGDGRMRALKAGTVKIWVTVDGVTSDELVITILPETQVTITSAAKVKVGKTLTLTADITPEISASLPAVWSIIEGGEYAEISGNTLTAKAVGVVTVRITVDGKSAEYTITIGAEESSELASCANCSANGSAVYFVSICALLLVLRLMVKKSDKKGDI